MKKQILIMAMAISIFGCKKKEYPVCECPNNNTGGTPTTLTLQPDGSTGVDAFLAQGDPNGNYGNHPEYAAIAWTCGGSQCLARNVIQFDLSSIPSNATITSAKLSLYSNPTPSNGNGTAMQGNNASYLQRVTSSWSETTVTWNNQPTTTTTNQVMLAQSTSSSQDYLDIDVKALVQDMVTNPATSHGFMIKLVNESYYASMIFASTDYTNPSVRPKLVVTYTK